MSIIKLKIIKDFSHDIFMKIKNSNPKMLCYNEILDDEGLVKYYKYI